MVVMAIMTKESSAFVSSTATNSVVTWSPTSQSKSVITTERIPSSITQSITQLRVHDKRCSVTRFTSTTLNESSSSSSNENGAEGTPSSEVERIREQAAKLRAEIAQMEGKTVEEVEQEARKKKADEQRRREETASSTAAATKKAPRDEGRLLVQVPATPDDMVRQAARAVERAFRDGKTRQTVRFNLISQDQMVGDENEWPGGAKQMYREAGKPLTDALLRDIHAPTKPVEGNDQRMPPTIKAQDLWDFDGSALHTAEAKLGASGDVQALVFPNTDVKYIKDIDTISESMGPRLFLLVNPFWRNVESWSFNLLAPNAKSLAQSVIFDNGFDESYVCMSFQARGEKCMAIKAYPYDWQLFAYLEDNEYVTGMESVIRLGSCKEEPTSALMGELLNERPEFKETKTMRQMKKMF